MVWALTAKSEKENFESLLFVYGNVSHFTIHGACLVGFSPSTLTPKLLGASAEHFLFAMQTVSCVTNYVDTLEAVFLARPVVLKMNCVEAN